MRGREREKERNILGRVKFEILSEKRIAVVHNPHTLLLESSLKDFLQNVLNWYDPVPFLSYVSKSVKFSCDYTTSQMVQISYRGLRGDRVSCKGDRRLQLSQK